MGPLVPIRPPTARRWVFFTSLCKKKTKELCLKNLNFLEIKIDRIFCYEDFSSRLFADLKSRSEYEFEDQIFTFSSILDPIYVMTWIPIEDRLLYHPHRRILADKIVEVFPQILVYVEVTLRNVK